MITLGAAAALAALWGADTLTNTLKENNQYDQSWKMLRYQYDRQAQENAAARAWSEYFWNRQYVAENKEYDRRWWSSFNATNEYNSPTNQIRLLNEAGLNGNLYGGDASAGQLFSAPQVPSSPVAPANTHPNVVFPNTSSSWVKPGSFLLQGVSTLSKAGKDSAETNEIRTLLSSKLIGQELANDSLAISNFIAENTKDVSIKKAHSEWELTCAKILLTRSEDFKVQEEALTEATQRFYNVASAKMNSKQAALFGMQLENYMEDFRSRLKLRDSQASYNLSASRQMDSLAKLHESSTKLKDLEYEIRSDPQAKKAQMKEYVNRCNLVYQQIGATKAQKEQLGQLARKLEKDADSYYYRLVLDEIHQTVDQVIDGYRAYTFQTFFENRKESDEFMRDHYDDVEEIIERNETSPTGHRQKRTLKHKRQPIE